jgi:hypothetical protein
VVATVLLRLLRAPEGTDATTASDYVAEANSPDVTRTAQRTTAGAEAGSPG